MVSKVSTEHGSTKLCQERGTNCHVENSRYRAIEIEIGVQMAVPDGGKH